MKRTVYKYLILLLIPLTVFASENKNYIEIENEDEWETLSRKVSPGILKNINSSYMKNVKPIFKKKCLDCHGTGNKKPWYYILPGVKQLMKNDIYEAKEHMDMSADFPFSGHGSPKEDLEAIERTVNENTMPPWQYKVIHWFSRLTKKEEIIIKNWSLNGIKSLKGEKK